MPKETSICPQLQYAEKRKDLPVRGKPHYLHKMGRGLILGVRRNADRPDKWVVKYHDGKQERVKIIGWCSDANIAADGVGVLDFHQAADKARKLRGDRPGDVKLVLVTLDKVLERYEKFLRDTNAVARRARHPRAHLSKQLLGKAVQLTTKEELEDWRDAIIKGGMTHVNYNNIREIILAAIRREAAEAAAVWRAGLPPLGDNRPPNKRQRGGVRNVILTDDEVKAFVAAAYKHDTHLGYLMHVLANTGNRPAQLARLLVEDFIDGKLPKLMMWHSRKSGGDGLKRDQKAAGQFSVPVACPLLAARLREAIRGRAGHEPLLVQANGKAWDADGYIPHHYYHRAMQHVVRAIGKDPKVVTAYALRHSSIVAMLKQGVAIRLVAAAHDTSARMIERHYSKHITDHADEILRKALLNRSVDLAAILDAA